MDPEAPNASMPAASAAHSDACDARAHKSRRLAHPADSKSPEEWVTALCNSRASFLATTAVPEDPADALRRRPDPHPLNGMQSYSPFGLDPCLGYARRMGWKNCFPNPGRRKMATPWAWHLLATRLHPQNSPFPPHLGRTHLRTRSTLTDVGPPSGFPNPLPSWRQALSEQGRGKSILPSLNSACFSWKQSRHRKEAPTVAMAVDSKPACNFPLTRFALLEALQKRLQIDSSKPELAINEILASHADPKYHDWKKVIKENTGWQLNPTDTGYLDVQCTGLGGEELDRLGSPLGMQKRSPRIWPFSEQAR